MFRLGQSCSSLNIFSGSPPKVFSVGLKSVPVCFGVIHPPPHKIPKRRGQCPRLFFASICADSPTATLHAHIPIRTHNVREWATVVPTGSFRYGIPLRYSPLKRDVFQSAAIREGTKPYACHAVRDSDGGQAVAISEGIYPYARHAVRDGDGGQVGAILEGRICNSTRSLSQFNRRYALVKVYHPAVNITYTVFFLYQISAATREGIYPYARHAVGNGDGGQAVAIPESKTPYARHAAVIRNNAVFATYNQSFARGLNNAIPCAMVDIIPLINHNRGQASAILEGTFV